MGDHEVKLATREELTSLGSFLERHLPRTCAVHAQLVYATRKDCPDGDQFYYIPHPTDGDYCAVVGLMLHQRLNSNKQLQKSWMVTAWSTNPSHLVTIYNAIDVIDWNVDYIRMFNDDCSISEETLLAFLKDKNIMVDTVKMDFFFLGASEALNMQISLPEEVYVRRLEPHHARFVYDEWWAKHTVSVDCIADVIRHLPSAGIFTKTDNQLICWAVCNPPGGGVSHLFTVKEHRGKGYARHLVKYLSKELARNGLAPFATITRANEASRNLFSRLGFVVTGGNHFFIQTCRDEHPGPS